VKTNAAIVVWVMGVAVPALAKDPPMPTPAPELATFAKAMAGTMTCTGKAFMPDKRALELTGTMTTKVELDGFWIHDSFAATMGKTKFAFESYTTVDKTDKQWHRVMVDSVGGYLVGVSPGPGQGKLEFTLDGAGPLGPIQFRDHLDTATGRSWGERSMDHGKTWVADYDVVCKKK
jgi:hypothetical protein